MSIHLSINMPDDALSVLRKSPEEFAQELKYSAVCKWYELGLISQSKAAHLAGLSRHDFLALLNRYGVSPFQTNIDELKEELERG